jgi:hypothetical protein
MICVLIDLNELFLLVGFYGSLESLFTIINLLKQRVMSFVDRIMSEFRLLLALVCQLRKLLHHWMFRSFSCSERCLLAQRFTSHKDVISFGAKNTSSGGANSCTTSCCRWTRELFAICHIMKQKRTLRCVCSKHYFAFNLLIFKLDPLVTARLRLDFFTIHFNHLLNLH